MIIITGARHCFFPMGSCCEGALFQQTDLYTIWLTVLCNEVIRKQYVYLINHIRGYRSKH